MIVLKLCCNFNFHHHLLNICYAISGTVLRVFSMLSITPDIVINLTDAEVK